MRTCPPYFSAKMRQARGPRAVFPLHPHARSEFGLRSPAARQKTFPLLHFPPHHLRPPHQLRSSEVGQLLTSHFAHTQLHPIRKDDGALTVAIPVDFTDSVEVDNR